MELKDIKSLWISKELFDYAGNVKSKISYTQWVEYVEFNQDYYLWLEDTEEGKDILSNIEKIPESFREGVMRAHNKSKVVAEFNKRKGFYEVSANYNHELGIISISIQKKIERVHLEKFLAMAKHVDSLLLNNGTDVIDIDVLNFVE